MARRVGSRKRWHINLYSAFTLLLWLPAIVKSGGYDDLGSGGGSSNSGSSSGGSSDGSSDGSSGGGSSDGGVDISDYASNNGQIPNHLVCKSLNIQPSNILSYSFLIAEPT